MKKVDIKPKITTLIFLDTRRSKKNGLYPVKLKLTFQRKRKYYNIKIDLSKEDFEKIISPKSKGKNKQNRLYLQSFEQKANEIIDDLDFFTFEIFEDKFFSKSIAKDDVFYYYDNYIKELKDYDKIGTAINYKHSKKSLQNFINKKHLSFSKITVKFLNSYEKYVLSIGNSITTVGIYLRPLRKLYNDYLRNNDLTRKNYPFGKGLYQIPKGRNIKKALSFDDIKKIFEYEPEQMTNEHFAKDIFIFSYLSSGMNISDILRLRFKNINNNKVEYIREKTKNTTKTDLTPITATLTKQSIEIIERWQNEDQSPENFIFPHLNTATNETEKRRLTQQTTKTINKYLKRIASKLDLKINLTTYVARHSYATVLKRKGVSTEYISESLGHSDLKTTKNYLDSFDDDTKREYTNLLL